MRKLILIALMMVAGTTIAQSRDDQESLYWVVETNKNTPDHSVVKIYNQENVLLRAVTVSTKLDIRKKRDRKTVDLLVKKYTGQQEVLGRRLRSKSSV